MDDDALNIQNWGYYEPSPAFKGHHLSLQLMSSMADRDTKHFIQGRDPNNIMVGAANGGAFHQRDCMVSDPSIPMNYGRDNWMNPRDKYFNMMTPTTTYPTMFLESSGAHNLQMVQHQNPQEKTPKVEEATEVVPKEGTQSKKRQSGSTPKTPKPKKARKPRENSNNSLQLVKPPKKSLEVVINGIDMDISGIPIPVCSCTGTPQQCYRWGCGGWQSACCTTNVSTYPLPMSTKRRGARIAGRKMSQGAFKKVLEKLAAEGYNFVNPIDLRTHWAKHGTNKFVTIR